MNRSKIPIFDKDSIASLKEAANLIRQASALLESNKENYQASNLSVAEAVDHVLSCLAKDSAYLIRLSEISEESASHLSRFEND